MVQEGLPVVWNACKRSTSTLAITFTRTQILQARLDALEDGLDEDALAVGDDDDEFEVDDELDLDGKGTLTLPQHATNGCHLGDGSVVSQRCARSMCTLGCRLSRLETRLVRLQMHATPPTLSGKGKSKKRKSGSKRKMKVTGIPAASSFAVLLEESGVYEDKLPEPHYLSVETEAAKVASSRTFCQVCGNFSKYRCTRCREPYCSLKCYKTHNELRCLKFAL